MEEQVRKARTLLKHIGTVVQQLEERKAAHTALYEQMEKVKEKPSRQNVHKLSHLLEEALEVEKIVAKSHAVESKRVQLLLQRIEEFAHHNVALESKVKHLEDQLHHYHGLKQEKEEREALLSKKVRNVNQHEVLSTRLRMLEKKYKDMKTQLTPEQEKALQEKIFFLQQKIKNKGLTSPSP